MKHYASCHPLSRVYVTYDSFGEKVPLNWEEVATAMNERIDRIVEDAHITEEGDYPDYEQLLSITRQAETLWRNMLDGQLPDIVPVYQ